MADIDWARAEDGGRDRDVVVTCPHPRENSDNASFLYLHQYSMDMHHSGCPVFVCKSQFNATQNKIKRLEESSHRWCTSSMVILGLLSDCMEQ